MQMRKQMPKCSMPRRGPSAGSFWHSTFSIDRGHLAFRIEHLPLTPSEAESRAEVELGAAAVERPRDFEVQVEQRGVDEEPGADGAELRRARDPLPMRGDPAAVDEGVDSGAADHVERGRERHAQLRGPEQALV